MFARLQNFFERIFSVCLSFFNWRSDEASLRRPISNLQWPRKNIAEDYYPLIRCSTLAAANLQKDKTNELEDTPARKLPKCRKSVSVISTWRRRIASLDGRKRCRCKQRERESNKKTKIEWPWNSQDLLLRKQNRADSAQTDTDSYVGTDSHFKEKDAA